MKKGKEEANKLRVEIADLKRQQELNHREESQKELREEKVKLNTPRTEMIVC